MTTLAEDQRDVLTAADTLVEAFARSDAKGYFACFDTDATFVFHTSVGRLESRAEYQAEWDRWEREDGFRVLDCASSERRVQLLGDVAVFTHTVRTTVATHAGQEALHERETIILRRATAGWLAVHEHLSPHPAGLGSSA
jgi:ketosteroid isomerase-like protein